MCNSDPGSQFNVAFWPGVRIQRGILTRGQNSTSNLDPSTNHLPVELRLKKVSTFNSLVKIQQLWRVTIQRKIFNGGVKILSYNGVYYALSSPQFAGIATANSLGLFLSLFFYSKSKTSLWEMLYHFLYRQCPPNEMRLTKHHTTSRLPVGFWQVKTNVHWNSR